MYLKNKNTAERKIKNQCRGAMSARKLVAIFKVEQREFSLYLHQYEFILELKPVFQRNRQQPRQNAWLAFADEPTLEDVAENINAFEVMQQTRSHLLKIIFFQHQPRYFYFHASTARKACIYPRFAQRLVEHLPKYRYCQEGQSFYFYAQD